MANALFDSGRDGFLKGEFDWTSDIFKVILLSNQYTVDLINHTTTANVGGTVAISGAMTTHPLDIASRIDFGLPS